MANKLEDMNTPEWETVDEAIRSRLTEVTTWLKEHASEGSFGGPGEWGAWSADIGITAI